jgi:putative endonuclease
MFAWIATRTGVQLPSPPTFALRHEKRRLSRRSFSVGGLCIAILSPCLKDSGLAGQPPFFITRSSAPDLMKAFHHVYILVSEIDHRLHYSGITDHLNAGLAEHNRGKCPHTSKYTPWKIETAVAFRSEAKARRFDRYLKTGSGREFARRHTFKAFATRDVLVVTTTEARRLITHWAPDLSHSLQICGRPFGLARA